MKNISVEKEKIRAFIYLDEYKMYSISSQIFEGLTEYVINRSKASNDEFEEQKGPKGSGRIMADIIGKESSIEERKFLHDYSYKLFEEKLFNDNKVLMIDSNNISAEIGQIKSYEFVKVKGRALFNDFKVINDLIDNYNDLGEAITLVSDPTSLNKKAEMSKSKGQGFGDSNIKSGALLAKARELGLHIDDKFLKSLGMILDYGYKDNFEIGIYLPKNSSENYLFTSSLERNYLRENEHLIVNKFSRYSEKEFIIFGMVSQMFGEKLDTSSILEKKMTGPEMKQAVFQMLLVIQGIENHFAGKYKYETIIDPIAVYREL